MRDEFTVKTVVYYVYGDMLPTNVGNKKAMFEYFRYLVSLREMNLRLCIIGNVPEAHQTTYREMGAELFVIKPCGRWSSLEVLNKFTSRLGIDMWRTFFSGLAYRRAFGEICKDADVVIMNYACWFELLPRSVLKDKTIVLTLDLFFYRRASIMGQNFWRRISVGLNRRMEISVLQRFARVAVLAGYEEKILEENGIAADRIIRVGMPLTPPPDHAVGIPFAQRKYDFVYVASKGRENELTFRCFIESVVPLLPNRDYSIVVAGGICDTIDCTGLPENFRVIRLGFVEDVGSVFGQARIGIGTVPCGSGIKVKVVEMAMYLLPIVVKNSGAEGIPLRVAGFVNIDQMSEHMIKSRIEAWLLCPEQAQRDGYETGMGVRAAFSADNILRPLKSAILN